MGIDEASIRDFWQGTEVEFQFPTAGGDPVFGFAKLDNNRLQSTILSINNESGAGAKAFFQFRNRSLKIAREFGVRELELSGMAVINDRIKSMLERKGFTSQIIRIPEIYGGGGEIEVLTKIFSVK